jgi:hypothetical protein
MRSALSAEYGRPHAELVRDPSLRMSAPAQALLAIFLQSPKNRKHSYILLNARKGVYRALTARMSYVLSLESLLVWHWPRYTDRSLDHYSGSL